MEIFSEDYPVQWIWGVLSGFPKTIPFSAIKSSFPLYNDYDKYPFADGYAGFWKNPLTVQHPLAVAEIVPWDGMFTLVISDDSLLIEKLDIQFPYSTDLKVYNDSKIKPRLH